MLIEINFPIRCLSLDYAPIKNIRTDLDETNERQSNDQYRYNPAQKSSSSYIQSSKTVYLNDYLVNINQSFFIHVIHSSYFIHS